MVAATREGLDRISAERRARWLQRRRRRRAFWLVVAALVVAGLGAAVWRRGSGSSLGQAAPTRHMPVRPLTPLPDSLAALRAALPMVDGVAHGDPTQRMVALTFDDGPSGRTPAILRVLANHDAHATFFVVGRATRGMEPVLRHMAATGNELADHTYSHANLLALPGVKRMQQLRWTRALVERATGVQPRFFRPPSGATGPAVNRLGRSLGMLPVLWSVDSRDWQLPGTKAIVKRVLAHVEPGSIVLMHDGGGGSPPTRAPPPPHPRAPQGPPPRPRPPSGVFAAA